MIADPHSLSATRLLAEMDVGALSAEELLDWMLDRIERLDPGVGAYLTLDEEGARRAARMADRRRSAGEPAGALGGVPLALKDNLCTEGLRTTCSSRSLDDYIPPYDAHVVQRLRLAGAVILGKLNMDEFAMGSSCEHAGLGRIPCNPWDAGRVTGGSSGGSAAALAAGLATLALGSDTGGSIRLPAAFTGVVGLKPTYGRVSRYGLIAFGSSLDQIGPMARNVADCALLLEVIAGYDRRDATSVAQDVPRYGELLSGSLEDLRIGVPREYWGEGLDEEVRRAGEAALECFAGLGARIVPVELPHTSYCISCYYVVATSEASSNLARYDGVHYGRCAEVRDLYGLYARSRAEGFGPEVKRRILLGTFALSSGYYDAYYVQALKVRRLIRQDFDQALSEADLLLSPTVPFPAFERGARLDDPLQMYLCDVLTVGANLAGLPGISLPCGRTSAGLPIGLQLLAPPLQEARLLRAAHAFEAQHAFRDQVAPL